MVEIASNLGDGATYDIPFLKLAGGLATKLAEAPAPDSPEAHALAPDFQHNLSQMEFDGKKFQFVRAIPTGNMHYETVLALSAALQDTYDHLPHAQDRPPVRFFSAIAVEYIQDDRRKVHLSCFEPEQWKDETCRENLKDLYMKLEQAQEAGMHIGVLPMLVAASPDPDVSLPAVQIKRELLRVQERMFDHDRYKFGKHVINGEEYVEGVKLLQPSTEEAADRLLPLVAQVYGAPMLDIETKKGQAYILGKEGFEVLERGEMPQRYKGMEKDD